MKNYKRLTEKDSCYYDEQDNCDVDELYARLAELEDKIENGTLVPKYSVVESCGTYYVCSVDTENLPIIDEYETEEEAQKKLEKLEK
jgi:hypothetical protein